jgi:hypothetical protein
MHPDTCNCSQLNSCTLINSWLRDNFVPRRYASVHLPTFRFRDRLSAIYQNCTTTCVILNKLCNRTAKTRAIPSLHRDNFLAKVPGHNRCSRRVTQPPFIAGPLWVMQKRSHTKIWQIYYLYLSLPLVTQHVNDNLFWIQGD